MVDLCENVLLNKAFLSRSGLPALCGNAVGQETRGGGGRKGDDLQGCIDLRCPSYLAGKGTHPPCPVSLALPSAEAALII